MSLVDDIVRQTNQNIIALTAQIMARNEIDTERVMADERREIREFKFKMWMLAVLSILAGIKVAELAGVIP